MIITTSLLIILNKNYSIITLDIKSIEINTLILIKIYTNPANTSIIILASYLLFTIITVFKITESNKGPLRIIYN